MANEFRIRNGFFSQGNSQITGSIGQRLANVSTSQSMASIVNAF